MKKRLGILWIGICIGLTGCQHNDYRAKFQRIAEAENASCPRRLDKSTVMDSTRYDANQNTVHYYYTLSGELDDAIWMKENAALFQYEMQKAVNNLPETQDYCKHQVLFHIVYHSKSTGKILADFSFHSSN